MPAIVDPLEVVQGPGTIKKGLHKVGAIEPCGKFTQAVVPPIRGHLQKVYHRSDRVCLHSRPPAAEPAPPSIVAPRQSACRSLTRSALVASPRPSGQCPAAWLQSPSRSC